MIKISLSTKKLLSNNADCYAYIVEKNFDAATISNELQQACPDFEAIAKQRKFTGNLQEAMTVPLNIDGKIAFGIVVGIGKDSKSVSAIERYRRALGQLVKEVRACKGTSVAIEALVKLGVGASAVLYG